MADRAQIVAFCFTIIGASYLVLSFALAQYVNRQFSYIYYIGLYSYFDTFTVLVTFWAAAHMLDKNAQPATWAAIILALGAANLGNLIIVWSIPINQGFPTTSQGLPTNIGLTLLPAPLLMILGGIVGLVASRHVQRQPI